METDLLDQAQRLLEREPTRCLDAAILHGRSSCATGAELSLERFMDRLAGCAERFTVIRPELDAGGLDGWAAEELAAYRSVLRAGGCLVTLAERAPEYGRREQAADPAPGGLAPHAVDTAAAILEAVHDSLAQVLVEADRDSGLRDLAEHAVHELQAVGRGLLSD